MKIFQLLLLAQTCLIISVFSKDQRIIGGQEATAGQYPFMAAIYKTTSEGNYFCGGALIYRRWILTAGQCVHNATLFTIYLGTNNIKNPGTTALKLATDEYILHPEYNPTTLENDIGLIKLRMNVTYTEYITGISLAIMDLNLIGQVYAVGWGQTNDASSELVDDLQTVSVSTLSMDDCRTIYGSQIKDTMMCVAGKYNEGTCHGDTGSPAISYYKYAPFHQGIASFVSNNGCESTDPSGFTSTYAYLKWIANVTSA